MLIYCLYIYDIDYQLQPYGRVYASSFYQKKGPWLTVITFRDRHK